jgi:hypothetical protein
MSVRSTQPVQLFSAAISLLIFDLRDLSITDNRPLKSPAVIVLLYCMQVSLQIYQHLLYIFKCYICNFYIFLLN